MSASTIDDETRKRLDSSLARGIAWTGGVKWATQFVRWASTLVIARLLTPQDYGLVGMATVYLGLVQLISEFGLSAAIVQHRDLDESTISQLGGLSVIIGLMLTGLSVVCAPLISGFFSAPNATGVIAALSASFTLRSLQVVPRALLTRDMTFRQLAALDGTEAISLALVTLGFAAAGFSYWALVIGSLTSIAVTTVIAMRLRPHAMAWPRHWDRLRASLHFGGNLVVSRLAFYSFSNADLIIVGRRLGTAALGAYSFGATLANLPVDRITSLVATVTPTIFSAVQNNRAELRRYFLAVTEGLALITLPTAIGLSLVSGEFVAVVLGNQWKAAATPLAILSLYGGIRSVTALIPQVLFASGFAKQSAMISVFAAIVLPLLFVLGSNWGTTGVAVAWLIGYPLLVLPLYARFALRAMEARPSDLLGALWPAVSSSLLMFAAVSVVRWQLGSSASAVTTLVTLVLTGAVSYGVTLLVAHRTRLVRFRDTIRALRER